MGETGSAERGKGTFAVSYAEVAESGRQGAEGQGRTVTEPSPVSQKVVLFDGSVIGTPLGTLAVTGRRAVLDGLADDVPRHLTHIFARPSASPVGNLTRPGSPDRAVEDLADFLWSCSAPLPGPDKAGRRGEIGAVGLRC